MSPLELLLHESESFDEFEKPHMPPPQADGDGDGNGNGTGTGNGARGRPNRAATCNGG
jgi:hypothetical protein